MGTIHEHQLAHPLEVFLLLYLINFNLQTSWVADFCDVQINSSEKHNALCKFRGKTMFEKNLYRLDFLNYVWYIIIIF